MSLFNGEDSVFGAAPVVGRHKKTNSLAEFDPMFEASRGNGNNDSSPCISMIPTLSSSGTRTPTDSNRNSSTTKDVREDLLLIASQLEQQQTPTKIGKAEAREDSTNFPSRRSQRMSVEGTSTLTDAAKNSGVPRRKKGGHHRKAQSLATSSKTWRELYGPNNPSPAYDKASADTFSLDSFVAGLPFENAPGLVHQKASAGASGAQHPLKSPPTPQTNKKSSPSVSSVANNRFHLPWPKTKKQGHRKSKSLVASSSTWQEAYKNPSSSATASPCPSVKGSSLIDDLKDLSQQGDSAMTNVLTDLSVPSLAKPRPTSFLTGKEIVRSSEQDASQWQLEIPEKADFKLCCMSSQFLDTYRAEELVPDLSEIVGYSRLDLSPFASGLKSSVNISTCHRPIVESLLECGTAVLKVQGYIAPLRKEGDPDGHREILVLECQRYFLCVFRGTTAEQQGKFSKQPDLVRMGDNDGVKVFRDRLSAVKDVENTLFGLLDRLTEENPFYDLVFTGHAFGGGMATLAAYRYAVARPELRVSAMVTASPRIGQNDFLLSAHSLPNLKLVRLEVGSARTQASSGSHVGHTIRVTSAKNQASVKAYRFGDSKEPVPVRSMLFKRDKDIADYIEALDALGETWVKDFYRMDGAGVLGQDNEARNLS